MNAKYGKRTMNRLKIVPLESFYHEALFLLIAIVFVAVIFCISHALQQILFLPQSEVHVCVFRYCHRI